MILVVGLSLAFEPVVTELSGGGRIDWTHLELAAQASGRRGGGLAVEYEKLEGDARSQLGPAILDLARRIPFAPGTTTGDLLGADNAVADRLDDNLGTWEVYEARYYASGSVELDGALSLPSFLRPALIDGARGEERSTPAELPVTGLILDLRGLTVEPILAPAVRSADGGLLYTLAAMTRDAASLRTPCVYVTDPADPIAVRRAGDQPLFLTAIGVESGEIRLDVVAADALRTAAAGAPFLLHGNVVIVVDGAGRR